MPNFVTMILVTGGTGLVGAHLLLRLTGTGKNIRALYRNPDTINKTRELFASHGDIAAFNAVEWVLGDITDVPSLEDAFVGITQVYHCAAHISFNPDEEETQRKVNIEGTANMVNCALAFGVQKFCHVSSVAALGDPREGDAVTEETDWNPEVSHHDYALSKFGAEMEVWRAWQEGLSVVVINPGLIFGDGFWNQGSGSMFTTIHKGLYFYTDGSCGVVAVDDVVNAMMLLMDSEISGERYTLVAENMKYRELLSTIAHGLGKRKPQFEATRLLTSFAWRMDWLLGKLMIKKRSFTRAMARSSHKNELFDSSKAMTIPGFNFTEMKPYLLQLAAKFIS